MSQEEKTFPPQHQEQQPGIQSEMKPKPEVKPKYYKGSSKLKDKVALITGGDSGIGASVAILFAREGANIVIVYKDEHSDAENVRKEIEKEERFCLLLPGDVGDENFCMDAIQRTIDRFGKLDILVNNAGEQWTSEDIGELDMNQMEKTFRTNIFSMFYMVKAARSYLKEGSSIINTASITAYQGNPQLLDYSATKGAIVAFTRSLSLQLIKNGIRVNAVAPGPTWTPLIPASYDEEKVSEFGSNTPMKRAGEPWEVATSYVFLASEDGSYFSGQVLHPNGGRIVNG